MQDKLGNIWFGTYGGGVTRYDGSTFTHFTEKEGLSNNFVVSMLEDRNGDLWFGTIKGGVTKYDGSRFAHFTEKEGLSNNVVMSMAEDRLGNLWFGTRIGLNKLTQNKLIKINQNIKSKNVLDIDVFFKNYTYEDGFLGIGVNGGKTICEDNSGIIWIASTDRLTAYHPPLVEFADTVAPNIQITNLDLFYETIPWSKLNQKKDSTFTLGNGVNITSLEFDGVTKWFSLPQNLSLVYNNNYLIFNFIGITMSQPQKVKYKYKLEGIDENWSALTSRTEAPYGNLPNGNYTFQVKAMNSEGYWSNPLKYNFTIRPPFWKTWWFRTFIGLIVISSIWVYIKSREKK